MLDCHPDSYRRMALDIRLAYAHQLERSQCDGLDEQQLLRGSQQLSRKECFESEVKLLVARLGLR